MIRDNSLDIKIEEAARKEFSEKGYRKTSLASIAARSGITTGALYSRYKSKDDIFRSLVDEALKKFLLQGRELRQMYECARKLDSTEELINAIAQEEAVYFSIIYKYYDESILIFCRSEGSSVDRQLKELIKRKTDETVEFLKKISDKESDYSLVELIINEQINLFCKILERRFPRDKAIIYMEAAEDFLMAGWKSLFEKMKNA